MRCAQRGTTVITLAIALVLGGCTSGTEPAGTPSSAYFGKEPTGTASSTSDPSSEQAWATFLIDQLWVPTGNFDEAHTDITEERDPPYGPRERLARVGRPLAELGRVAHDSLSEKLATDGAATVDLAAKIEAVIDAGGRAERTGKAAVAYSADDGVFASAACRGAFEKVDEAGSELYEALEPWGEEVAWALLP